MRRSSSSGPSGRPPGWLAWLAPPAMLAGVLVGVAWVKAGPTGLWGYVLAALFAVAMGWIVVSVLWPARADRTCPRCGSEELERVDPRTTVGIRCAACGFVDESKSSWLLAEEEGPLEGIVLEQRERRRGQRRRRRLQPDAEDRSGA